MIEDIKRPLPKSSDEQAPKQRRHVRPSIVIGFIALALVVCAACLLLVEHNTNRSELPNWVIKSSKFALFYPSPLPAGYVLKQDSVRLQGDVLFYTLQSDRDSITVSEQAAPVDSPDLSGLLGFTNIKTLAGNTAIGVSLNKPVAIILNNTTLIEILADRQVPSSVIETTARSMNNVPQ